MQYSITEYINWIEKDRFIDETTVDKPAWKGECLCLGEFVTILAKKKGVSWEDGFML